MTAARLVLLWLAAALTSACASDGNVGAVQLPTKPSERHFDIQSVGGSDPHHITIRANFPIVGGAFLQSNATDDIDCEHGHALSSLSLASSEEKERSLTFSRKGSPSRALYEWHFCFRIDGVVYRAWRGFDPGPGTELEISCFVDEARIRAKDRERYLCRTDRITQNPANHGEYAVHCWGEGLCKGFETKDAHDNWRALNPMSQQEQLKIAAVILEYIFSSLSAQEIAAYDFYLDVSGKYPPREFLEDFMLKGMRIYAWSDYPSDEDVSSGFKMRLSISWFEQTRDGVASGQLFSYCGFLCAHDQAVEVEKVDGQWRVKSFKTILIS